MAKQPSIESLKAFVRRGADSFLEDPNVTSVGVGFKVTDGKITDDLSIQFTVGKKMSLDVMKLEGVSTEPIPKSFTVDGIEVPTDVLERSYDTKAKEVKIGAKLEIAAARKSFANPIQPGISVGHPKTSAGTLGCIVYDAKTGQKLALSNWHVLHTPLGSIGDEVMQPGPHDDNSPGRNRFGRLLRSHLGPAGDCAVASIEDREVDDSILDLNTTVKRIGEPELGDEVVKSGRTTSVTYGVVSRIHVQWKHPFIVPNPGQPQTVGCFEISERPADKDSGSEISSGGDSGSAWLWVKNGAPTDMMVGLHMAGETGNEPEHALANYAESVFEKLQIVPSPDKRPQALEVVTGYDENFLGEKVGIPVPGDKVKMDLGKAGPGTVVNYTHFSLTLSKSRKMAHWVAWNIDGGSLKKLSRKEIPFKKDPNVPADLQVGDELYKGNKLDRGHIARRADLLWGPLPDAEKANRDSFFFTNITPQHEAFNQSGAKGIWGELENAIFSEVDVQDLKVSVMGGPIFQEDDKVYRKVKLPKSFWKTVYFRENGVEGIQAKAYILTQEDLISDLSELEALELPEFSVYEVPLSRLEAKIGFALPRPAAGSLESLEAAPVRRIGSANEIVRAVQ